MIKSVDYWIREFNNKNIAIVGNASSILDKADGEIIDRMDYVIRMNRGFPRRARSQGRRTDILAISCKIKRWQHRFFYKSPPIIWMTPKRDGIPSWVKRRGDYCFYPEKYCNDLSEALRNAGPSTGCMTVDLVCNYATPKKVNLFGFDFKETHTLGHSKLKMGPHDWSDEKRFVLNLLRKSDSLGFEMEIW
ncbi:MAG: glycosyltransferase family 29 protein [Verrucomicrobia bacterium]|nr:glycosyltransferase family 29 protein [Verrucomicrobiota bacterium]